MIFYGIDVGFSWKGLNLSFLIQGVANRDLLLTGPGMWAFLNNGAGQAYHHILNRWTPETASTATFPRLSIGKNPNNNVVSSFWVRSGSYVRLRNASLSYTFNGIAFGGGAKIKQLKIFVNALNLLTISDFNQTNPAVLRGAYPVQRVVNGGITIKF